MLDRYIRRHLCQGFVIALLVLVSIFSFLDFVEEIDDTVFGNYGVLDALWFILMTVPERALWLVPVSALLGTLIGLGMLDQGSELTVMRSAGLSAGRIRWAVLKAAALLIGIVIVFAQFISPALGERAWRARALAIAGDIVLRKESGTNFWFRDGRRFISIRDMVYGRIPTGIEIYEFDDDGKLIVFTEAREAERRDGGAWLLRDVTEKCFSDRKIARQHRDSLLWREFLSPEYGAVIELDADSLAPSDLYRYARDLRARGQSADRYELSFWRKINVPLALVAMVMVALPFVLGRRERPGAGLRLLIGAGIGVAFYVIDQMIAQIGLLTGINAAITATVPALSLFVVALIIWKRVA